VFGKRVRKGEKQEFHSPTQREGVDFVLRGRPSKKRKKYRAWSAPFQKKERGIFLRKGFPGGTKEKEEGRTEKKNKKGQFEPPTQEEGGGPRGGEAEREKDLYSAREERSHCAKKPSKKRKPGGTTMRKRKTKAPLNAIREKKR